jgi:hypothetical protein
LPKTLYAYCRKCPAATDHLHIITAERHAELLGYEQEIEKQLQAGA